MSAIEVDYAAEVAGDAAATFATRGAHALTLNEKGREAVSRWVYLASHDSDKVHWPQLAEAIGSSVRIAHEALDEHPFQVYITGAAWKRWVETLDEVMGRGCTPAVLSLAGQRFSAAIAGANDSARGRLRLQPGDLAKIEADPARPETAANKDHNARLRAWKFLQDLTFRDLCGAEGTLEPWARLAMTLGS